MFFIIIEIETGNVLAQYYVVQVEIYETNKRKALQVGKFHVKLMIQK